MSVKKLQISDTRSLGPLRGPTSSLRPFGPALGPSGLLDFVPVCDETQNLNETESETFFRYQIFSIPNPILFPIPIFFRYRYRNFSKPIPILFSIPIFFETDTDTFFDTKFFRNRYRYFFRYQFFSKPIPILFLKPKIFDTDTDTIPTIGIVSKPRSLETEMSHSDTKSLWFHDLALFVRLFFSVCFQMFPQIACTRGCVITLIALFDFSPLCISNVFSSCLPLQI
mgnify:CR=1 FL=1